MTIWGMHRAAAAAAAGAVTLQQLAMNGDKITSKKERERELELELNVFQSLRGKSPPRKTDPANYSKMHLILLMVILLSLFPPNLLNSFKFF